jgi:hypothetical protein
MPKTSASRIMKTIFMLALVSLEALMLPAMQMVGCAHALEPAPVVRVAGSGVDELNKFINNEEVDVKSELGDPDYDKTVAEYKEYQLHSDIQNKATQLERENQQRNAETQKSWNETIEVQRRLSNALNSGSSGAGMGSNGASVGGNSGNCNMCESRCASLTSGCRNSQSSCYRAAACLCQCNIDAGGCGSSISALQRCVSDNTASANALRSR